MITTTYEQLLAVAAKDDLIKAIVESRCPTPIFTELAFKLSPLDLPPLMMLSGASLAKALMSSATSTPLPQYHDVVPVPNALMTRCNRCGKSRTAFQESLAVQAGNPPFKNEVCSVALPPPWASIKDPNATPPMPRGYYVTPGLPVSLPDADFDFDSNFDFGPGIDPPAKKVKPKAQCWNCNTELVPDMDQYWGKDEKGSKHCSPCRKKLGIK